MHNNLPVHFGVLFRRVVNVISTLSITNQYLHSRPSDQQFTSIWSWLVESANLNLDSFQQQISIGSSSLDSQDSRSEMRFALSFPDSTTSSTCPPNGQPPLPQGNKDTIHRLMNNPTLFDPVRAPRYPIVLCHGLYGFDVRGPAAFPSLRLHYWSSVLSILRHKLGAEVIVTGVPSTGSIASRAENLDRVLQQRACGRGINLVAHSMGGLDCRHLITHVRPTEYVPLSLTSISTPHRGSPFMDWCAQHLGLGRCQSELTPQRANDAGRETQPVPEPVPSTDPNDTSNKRDAMFHLSLSNLPSSFTTLLLSLLDSPAYANLTTSYLNDVFNPSTPDDPRVKYFSVASRVEEMNIWHPLWLPKMVLDDAERKAQEALKAAAGAVSTTSIVPSWDREDEWGNDGLVTVQSARWGELLGVLNGCDHWEIRGAGGMDIMNVELPSGIGNITNRVAVEGRSLGDWSRFIGAWKKQEKGGLELTPAASIVASGAGEIERINQDSRNDPVVKASTDKLSAVFDWIVDHVPSSSGSASPPKEVSPPKNPVKNDLATKFDLERFYVALTRKLYDEGL